MKSNLHKSVCSVIKELYPNETVVEEKAIKVGNKTLYLDIFLSRLKIAIEADGIQHSKFNKHFHLDPMAFQQQKKNDSDKEEYCKENGITLVRIAFNEEVSKDFITEKILSKLKE